MQQEQNFVEWRTDYYFLLRYADMQERLIILKDYCIRFGASARRLRNDF